MENNVWGAIMSEALDNKKLNVSADLADIFENVNKWLIFAESKNGVLLGINGLFLFKYLDSLNGVDQSILNGKMVWILLFIFMLSTIILLESFFPRCSVFSDKPIKSCEEMNDDSKILIFYGDICRYENSKLYLRDIYRYYYDIDMNYEDLNKYELDYSKEILINSRIASYKFKCFKKALTLDGLGMLLILIFHFIA